MSRHAPHPSVRTIAAAYDRTRNNFDALRFFLATLVLWSHAYSLAAVLDPLLAVSGGQMSAGAVGVEGFFVVSGFLVTQSWLGTGAVRPFLEKRARRLLPGLLVAMAFGVVLVGPWVTSQSWSAYFTSPRTWLHFPGLFAHQWLPVPGVFPNNTFRNQLNGSLWSLRYEIGCYALTTLLGAFAGRRFRAAIAVTACAAVAGTLVLQVAALRTPTWITWGMRLTACYAAGMALYAFRERIPHRGALAAAAALALVVATRLGGLVWVFPVAGAYLLVFLACVPRFGLERFGSRGDVSYGLYLYAFPVQQLLLHVLGPTLPVLPFFAMGFAATLPLAIASWRFVEAPMLRRPRGGRSA